MADTSAIRDATATHALGIVAGLVDHVPNDPARRHPARRHGADKDLPATANVPSRALHAVRDRAFGKLTPACPQCT